MSESVHAVLANKHHHQEETRISSPLVHEMNHHHDDEDEDDDIDIIGKFDPTQSFLLNAQSPSSFQQQQHKANLSNISNVGSNSFKANSDTSPQHQQPQQFEGESKTCDTEDEWYTDPIHTAARDRLRRALHYYFLSPIDKWRIKRRLPMKLVFQFLKIVLVTTQVILFGNNITEMRSVDNSMLISLHNLFLQNWDSSLDIKTVPPETGPYAVYTKDDLFSHIDFAIKNFADISSLSLGSIGYQVNNSKSNRMSPITICYIRYANATLFPSSSEYYIDVTQHESCLTIDNLHPPGSSEWSNFSYLDYLQQNHPDQIDFQSLLVMSIRLPLRTILLDTLATFNTPQCYDLDASIGFNNRPHSGEIVVRMAIHNKLIPCNGNLEDSNKKNDFHNIDLAINFFVLGLSIISSFLCLRTLWRAQALRRRVERFFAVAYKRNLDLQSTLHFVDGWILMILINDCLIAVGTSINILRKFHLVGPQNINSLRPIELDNLCSSLLGIGTLLVWFGLLRYLAFFNQYNILIVTIKHSLPRVLRFLLCVLILYGGFCFSGWIILGPYHYKFATLAGTSECLFALMNGDDVFATFAYLQRTSSFVWWFSRLYLYVYVLLFIYIVLSLFIAILMDSYETIKEFYNKRHTLSFLLANDLLSRFVRQFNANDLELTCHTSYRLSLLNDEEVEMHESHSPHFAHTTSLLLSWPRSLVRFFRQRFSSQSSSSSLHSIN